MEANHLEIASRGVAVHRPAHAGLALLIALPVLVVTGAKVVSLAPSGDWSGPLFCISFLTALASAATLLQRRLDPKVSAAIGRRAPGKLEVAGDTLAVTVRGARWTYPRASVVEGWTERLPDRVSVVLATVKGDLITAEVDTADEARRLLAAAGVSADRQVMRTRLAPVLSRHRAAGCVVIPVSLFVSFGAMTSIALAVAVVQQQRSLNGHAAWGEPGLWRAILISALFSGAFALVVAGLVPPRLVIGHDGVTIRGLIRRRFVPYARVAQLRCVQDAVELVLRGGDVIRLPVESRFVDVETAANPVREAIHDRIREAMETGAGERPAAAVAVLDREGRPFAAWREHLAALGRGRSDYRRAALSGDDIAAVLADVAAPRERRVAAAIALAQSDDDTAKARIRVAAQACADEALREAIEAAAEDELSEATLEKALREVR